MGPVVRVITDPTASVLGHGKFALRPTHGRYLLPRLEVTAVDPERPVYVHKVRIGSVRTDTAGLAAELMAAWQPSLLPADATAAPVRLPQAYLDIAPRDAGPGDTDPATAEVSWHVTHGSAAAALPDELEVIMELQFEPAAAAGTAPAAPAVTANGSGSGRAGHIGLVAVDFGTSNSTVTLYDPQNLKVRALGASQAERLRTDLAALLIGTPLPGRDPLPADCAGDLATVVEMILPAVLPGGAPVPRGSAGSPTGAQQRLVEALFAEDLVRHEPTLLHAVLLRVESERDGASEPLRSWLTARLHACYDDAFDVPALDRLNIFPVMLDPSTGSHPLASRLEITSTSPLGVRMGDEQVKHDGADSGGTVPTAILGLKQYLGNPETRVVSDGTRSVEVGTDQLIQKALGHLVAEADKFVAERAAGRPTRPLARVIATYPTVAPPTVRHHLRNLLTDPDGPGIGTVETEFDEAVAAVMFFLMRDLSGEVTHVVEAVKTRYQRLADTAWRQNVLVIDIGGGTTDIALVTLTLRDETGTIADVDERWIGRYYTLTPSVRGSTGKLQLGGEYLTLQVFRWLKAAIADRLLDHAPDALATAMLPEQFRDGGRYRSRSLLAETLASAGTNSSTLDAVDKVLPTSWAEDPDRERAFWLLWRLAERAKIAFGRTAPATDPFRITADELGEVLNSVADGVEPGLDLGGDLLLDAEPFDTLVEPAIHEVVRLATELALDRLVPVTPAASSGGTVPSGDAGPERLDRIILTGRSSALAQVRHAVTTRFGRVRGRDDEVEWKATGVVVEDTYPKLATSIGACWAASIKKVRYEKRDRAMHRLLDGTSELRIDVNNLLSNLPCAFSQGGPNSIEDVLIPASRQLLQLDHDLIGKARSAWVPLTRFFLVYRMTAPGEGPIWGSFQYDTHTPGFRGDPTVWPGQIDVQLEVTQPLDVSVALCRGTPHHVADGPSLSILDAVAAGTAMLPADAPSPVVDGKLVALPGDIVVNAVNGGSGEHRLADVVFAGWHPDSGEPTPFTLRLYESDDEPDAMGRPAARSADLPDDPDGWDFHLRLPDNSVEYIGRLDRPLFSSNLLATRWGATLDIAGTLRVHVGELPYRRAVSLEDVELRAGRVFRTPMHPEQPLYDSTRDPFNGTH